MHFQERIKVVAREIEEGYRSEREEKNGKANTAQRDQLPGLY